jgi:regulatory protein YycI of two-component signal transduction system YycFG|tara:strand:+ start:254 stop:496 length:243 start_codon:yes stop_codon:yes gene_type:complete
MRIDFRILKNIEEWYGSDDFEVGDVNEKEAISIRFGYWSSVELTELQQLLPHYLKVIENEVDEDEDTGVLYNYIIKRIYE